MLLNERSKDNNRSSAPGGPNLTNIGPDLVDVGHKSAVSLLIWTMLSNFRPKLVEVGQRVADSRPSLG